MKFIKKFTIAFGMLKTSKLRSWLTIIGIIIAVTSVTAILNIGSMINNEVERKLGDSGFNTYSLNQGDNFNSDGDENQDNSITFRDYEFLSNKGYIKSLSREISTNLNMTFLDKSEFIRVSGLELDKFNDFDESILISGRKLEQGDRKSIMISNDFLNFSFTEIKPEVGDFIEIDKEQFLIIGIYKAGGLGFSLEEAKISFEDANEIRKSKFEKEPFDEFGNLKEETYSSIKLKFDNSIEPDLAKKKLTQELRNFRNTNEENQNFTLQGKKDSFELINQIISTISLILFGFASISILVGSVGIANTMFTSVIEKTKEIGIMKAIGGKDKDIEHIFILNSGFLGIIGGIIGVILGLLISLISFIVVIYLTELKNFSYLSIFNFKIIFLALLLSVIIGMLSGFFPARLAAKQDPVEALRGN